MSQARDLSNLDFLRSLAVLMVSASHLCLLTHHLYWWNWWMGLSGVYIFFVHTSMVLMWSLERDPNPGRFYLRRAFRIYPLWLVVLGGYLLLRLPRPSIFAAAVHPSFYELVSNAALVFNFNFGERIVPASWSLPFEVQMYLVLPFLFFFLRSTRVLWPIVILDVYAMVWAVLSHGEGYTRLVQLVPCFLPGVMGYLLFTRVRPRLPGWSFPVCFLGLCCVMSAFADLHHAWLYCLLLGFALPYFKQVHHAGFNRVTHLVARYSYGIYLTHFVALTIAIEALAGKPMLVRVATGVALYVTLPVLLFHLVESPMIRMGSRLARKIGRGPEPSFNDRMISLEPAP